MARIDSPAFGALLRRSRRARGLTQEALAERAGVSPRVISALESDPSHRPRKDTLRLLTEALELSAEERMAFVAAAQPATVPAPQEEVAQDQGPRPRLPPSSVQTFLVADIRGYTGFTQERGDQAAAELATRFAELVEEVVTPWEGRVIETRGDEVLVALCSARGALHAAVALQAQLETVRAADPSLPLEVGIGLDAGEAVPVGEGYRGGALNLAARLCSLAAGGEVFASEGVIHLARKTEGLVFVDRGEVRLKGLSSPVRVIQIAREGMVPEELPPLQPILVTHPTNLPDEPTPFIGREAEIAALVDLLEQPSVRLVTLTGTGGTGKTRLALQAGSALLDAFRDGVFFVSLGQLTDPALVPSAIAGVLGVQEAGGVDLVTALISFLKDKHLLLVLDNYEHLLAASWVVSSLLAASGDLHILVTSRTPLHLLREHEYPVPPLAVPASSRHLDPVQLSQYDAVALFVARARAVRPDFHVTDENAPAVAEICCRLDGLPLAIELAAARIRLFPPHALLQRLSSRLKLLTGGARDLPARQQTLRSTIDWSYGLLGEGEKRLFARLSVFAGGCTLEAAEAVCIPDGDLEVDVLDGVTSLVEKSLVREEGEEEPRFLMLETIREYAAERLERSAEAGEMRRRHAKHFLAFAEQSEWSKMGPAERRAWLERVAVEHDNLVTALAWSVEDGAPEHTVRLALALAPFWASKGYLSEGRRWLETALGMAGGDPARRAAVLMRLGPFVRFQGNLDQAREYFSEAVELRRELGDKAALVESLQNFAPLLWNLGEPATTRVLWEEALGLASELGNAPMRAAILGGLGNLARYRGEYEEARRLLTESVGLLRNIGGGSNLSWFLGILGVVEAEQGEYERAQAHGEEALAIYRDANDRVGVARGLTNLASLSVVRGDYPRAVRLAEEAGELFRHIEEQLWLQNALVVLGVALTEVGDTERAREVLVEGLTRSSRSGNTSIVPEYLEGLAGLFTTCGQVQRAARLCGAGEAAREHLGAALSPSDRVRHEGHRESGRTQLGGAIWQAAWEEGRAMTLMEAIKYALDDGSETIP